RDRGGVGRRVLVRVDLDELAVRRARERALARQVEVAVVGQVDDRVEVARLVGRHVVQPQLVPVVQRVGQHHLDRGRVAGAAVRAAGGSGRGALVAVRAVQGELHAHGAVTADRLAGPDVITETDDPAVQGVRPVVDGQGV